MAHALPAGLYHEPTVFARERQTVWRSEWLVLAPAVELDRPGAYVATELAGWPVLAVVAPDGGLRAFHNVCPHRAGVLAWPGRGVTGNLVCRYHGWAFGWDGELRQARDFGDEALATETLWLTAISVERWRSLVWVNLHPAPPPLAAALGGFAEECAGFPMEDFAYGGRRVRDLACNWKTYVDNYLEGYHIPLLHPTLARSLDMATYAVEVAEDSYCVHRAEPADGSPVRGRWLFRYPNLAVNVYETGMNVERICPIGADRTQVVYDYFFADPAGAEEMIELSNVLLDEDQAICEAVQRNLAAGLYRAGPLSPRHEQGLAWFQRKLAGAIGEIS